MQFSTLIMGVMGALAATVSAQNPFTFTTLTSITAETPFNITWSPSTGTTDTVTLILRKGLSTDLDTVATIAAGITNSGFYVWTPSDTLVTASDYAFEIVDDGNTNIVNYSGQFEIITSVSASIIVASGAAPTTVFSSAAASITPFSNVTTTTLAVNGGASNATVTTGSLTASKTAADGGVSGSSLPSGVASNAAAAGMKIGGLPLGFAVLGLVMAML